MEPTTPTPPVRLKVYAENGTTHEYIGWLCIRPIRDGSSLIGLFAVEDKLGMPNQQMDSLIVVINQETGVVRYNPRTTGREHLLGKSLIRFEEQKWLSHNLHWPAILELEDHPVGEVQEK